MAKTQTITITDELKTLEARALERRERFILGVCQGHKREPSKAQKRLLRRKAIINSPMTERGSLFAYLADFWRELTPAQKQVWKDAGFFSSLTNWQTYISDNAARIRNNLTLDVPPSEFWQVRAGRLLIETPSNEIILKQEHPLDYWIAQKVPGKSWKYELVRLTEIFSFPLDLEIRYKSTLSAIGPTQSACFFARVWTSYQGEDILTDYVINFNSLAGWTLATLNITVPRGIIIGYTLFLEIVGYTGELLFDNIRAIHGGTNWARDPRCDDISKTFTKGFALVPPFWIPVSLPAGSSFSTEYPPAL